MRLHELAKEIGAESKALLKLAQELGLAVRNHSTNLAVGEIAILRAAFREEFGEAKVEEPPAEVEKPAKKELRVRKGAAPAEEEEVAAETEDEALAAPPAEEAAQQAAAAEAQAASGPAGGEGPPEIAPAADRPEVAPLAAAAAAVAAPAAEQVQAPVAAAAAEAPAPAAGLAPAAPQAPGAVEAAPLPLGEAGLAAAARQAEEAQAARKKKTAVRPEGGAKIVGRIELPVEEIKKARGPRALPGVPEAAASGEPLLDDFGHPHGVRGSADAGAALRDAAERRKAGKSVKGDPLTWSPDDEDDPLLQGIRLRNIQTGPHMRRPPRRVGPRRGSRRTPAPVPTGPLEVHVPITVRDLSQIIGVKAAAILNLLTAKGITAHVNLALDESGVLEVATGLNREVTITTEKGKEQAFLESVDAADREFAEKAVEDGAGPEPRWPVVAFLGHVDHGKTSLLDCIRKTNVAAGEVGGITQSMRAYSVAAPGGGRITFLDTPGHKAFTEMRARGANVTDIVVLVVAADDGVMPQTEEAIQHARAAGVPLVVAMNKMDRPEANPERVLQQLAHAGVMVEGWGGETQVARVSAVTGMGVADLLERIALQAEIMDLRADPKRPARGTVIESRKDDQLGAVATVLVQDGTLRQGDALLCGTAYGRVRTMTDDQGKKVKEAGPSLPVNVVGLNEAPAASEQFYVVEDLRKAKQVAAERDQKLRLERVSGPAPAGQITLENLFASLAAGKAQEVKVVLRCDVQGSLEVVRRSLEDLETAEVKVKTIRHALGGITEDDVLLALASQAVVIGFNVIADDKARGLAESKGVDIRTYQIIYDLIDEMKKAMIGVLSPLQRERVVGHVEIREVFKVSRLGSVAGCKVQDGVVKRSSLVRLSREGRVIYSGKLSSLKRFKDDVREVKEGLECGLKIDGYDDIKVADVLEVIEMEEEERTLDFAGS
ncbi:MAG: translation initiation factor IF-2 [Planctomycetes bacterium]|nr:translation initiation factor IF-2 [Planctomycetota bacterium]